MIRDIPVDKRAAPLAYRPLEKLENTPYVCLRLPTGGGKTLLGAYTISTAAQAFLEQDFPLVLWLVPTNTIRQQTLETLRECFGIQVLHDKSLNIRWMLAI